MKGIGTFITKTQRMRGKGHERDKDLYYLKTEDEGQGA